MKGWQRVLRRKQSLGWGDEKETAEFFGLSMVELRHLADSGEWPFYTIQKRRIFNIDDIVRILAQVSVVTACGVSNVERTRAEATTETN